MLFYFYFIFKSGFTPCADIVHQIRARQVVGIRLTTLIRHESEKNAQSWLTGRDMMCSTREFFVVRAFRLIYILFLLNFTIASRSFVETSGHLLLEYLHYHWLPCCVSPSDFDVSKTCRDQQWWRFLRDLSARIGHIRR